MGTAERELSPYYIVLIRLSRAISPRIVTTAAASPILVPAKLGGKPVHVLYLTRAGDTVLVRCYPGYHPTILLQAMGSKPSADAPIEGVMTCNPAV